MGQDRLEGRDWQGHWQQGLARQPRGIGEWLQPISPPSLLTDFGVSGLQVGGGWAELAPVHGPEEGGGFLEGADEGLGALGAIDGRVAQQGLPEQELLDLVLQGTWVGRSSDLQCPCTRTLPKPTPGCLQSWGSTGFPQGSLTPQGQGAKAGSWNHKVTGSLMLEKTSRITKSNPMLNIPHHIHFISGTLQGW